MSHVPTLQTLSNEPGGRELRDRPGEVRRPHFEPFSARLRHSHVVRSSLRIVTCLGLTAFALTTGLASQATGARSVDDRVAKDRITIRITLDRTRVIGGAPIKGTAVVTNHGSRGLLVQQCAIDGWLAVGLADRAIRFSPAFSLVRCPPSVVLAPGPNRFPLTVSTTYQACLQPGGRSTTFIPRCVPTAGSSSSLPPLPAGRYSTKVVTLGLPSSTSVSNSVVVTLLPAGR